MEVGCPGAATAITPQHPKVEEPRVTSTIRNPATSPQRKPPITPVTQKPKGPVEINNPQRKRITILIIITIKIMTTNPSKDRNPGNDSLREGRAGGDEENTCKTSQNNAAPQKNTPRYKDTKPSTTLHNKSTCKQRTQTVIWNTAGQGGALRHTTALER